MAKKEKKVEMKVKKVAVRHLLKRPKGMKKVAFRELARILASSLKESI